MLTPFQISALKHGQEVHNSQRKRKGKPLADVMSFWKRGVAASHVPWPNAVRPKRSQRKHWKQLGL